MTASALATLAALLVAAPALPGIAGRTRAFLTGRRGAPVLQWYERHGARVVTVEAVGDVGEVTKRALKALGR